MTAGGRHDDPPTPLRSARREELLRLQEWRALERHGFTLDIQPNPLPRQCISRLLRLLENNMRSLYEKSSWGWDRELKRSELCDPQTAIITMSFQQPAANSVAYRDVSAGIVGFISFQLSQEPLGENGAPVPTVYCYELQLESALRGRGLGKLLIALMESIGRRYDARGSMLSVFRFNDPAVRFYDKCGYRKHSPSDSGGSPDVLVLRKLFF